MQPPGRLAAGVVAVDRVLGPQLVGQERAAEADVVGDPHRLVEALGPHRLDLLDHRPGADALDPDLLVALEDCLGHVVARRISLKTARLETAKSLTRSQSSAARKGGYGGLPTDPRARTAMNFDFSDDQKFLKGEARKFLEARCPTAEGARGAGRSEPRRYDADLWKEVAAQGWLGRRDPGGLRRPRPRPPGALRDRRGARPRAGADPLRLDRLLPRRGAAAGRLRGPEGRSGCRRSPPAR